MPLFKFSFIVPFRLVDKGFIEFFGPFGLSHSLNNFSKKISYIQTGLIYQYTFLILIGIFFYVNLAFFAAFFNNFFALKFIFFNVFLLMFFLVGDNSK